MSKKTTVKLAKGPQRKSRARASSSRKKFQPSDFPAEGDLRRIYSELLKYPNVTAVYIGRKKKKGRELKQLAIVCCVEQKVTPRRLGKEQRLPKRIKWPRTRSKHFDLVTDVRVLDGTKLHASPVVGPGDELQASAGAERATIGLALLHPDHGAVVTTAGHAFMQGAGTIVFPGNAPLVDVANLGAGSVAGTFAARPLKASRVAEADYALLKPSAEARNLFNDALNVSAVHEARPEDVGTVLFCLRRGESEGTILRGVHSTANMGGVQMTGLLLTDSVTEGGDSGCCLVDQGLRVWGLLVGEASFEGKVRSVFSSAQALLTLERSPLV